MVRLELGEFLDLFYAEKVKAEEQEQQEQDIQDTVEKCLEILKIYQRKYIQVAKQRTALLKITGRKKKMSHQFGKIPDFTCTNHNNAGGCGKGWWIGNKDLPTEWL